MVMFIAGRDSLCGNSVNRLKMQLEVESGQDTVEEDGPTCLSPNNPLSTKTT